ncbi:hypothetical protein CBR_g49870 [Chara braunii]|uniref:DNA replication licensing factor MCM7 n=1 Tax=Chara braunii TaxID=69332 RepID=A0A388JP59_CHABU|nr:hypothetical protein CBR_g49870 [Chara braunii]|eukprot:GBG59606.1 hypothetical protein CBR_g49870 [Chara braunii]
MALHREFHGPDFSSEKEKCRDFLLRFASDKGAGRAKYMDILHQISNRASRRVDIELNDVEAFENGDMLVASICSNARRYISIFSEAIDEIMPEPTELQTTEDVFDVLMRQRMEENGGMDGTRGSGENPAGGGADGSANRDSAQQLPPSLRRRYEVRIKPLTSAKPRSLREVKAADIGHLVCIKGIVTRVTDVKPLMSVATYTCDICGFEIYQEVTGRTFMPLVECPSARCKMNNMKGQLHLQTRGSKFIKFQEAKIQEMADQVPKGNIPRSMTVHLNGELTRLISPGDVVALGGIFLPAPQAGFRAMRAGLVADTYLETMSITQYKKRYEEYEHHPEAREEVDRIARGGEVYNRLSRSIAPEIYGHDDVKKALLLLLVGAPSRQLKDGMKIRGDLHVCLMGDPGVAKSQLLKHIVMVAPRGVYTTGRGSSGVGLTAAVHRDSVTSEMVLEGGALVLADMGICAIDEFDKMEESDRTAIHEVMEQQTVSIAKAGITTSLNARTAVLAAANPAWGRYDMRRTPAENINLPPALLSRFDLMWLILDQGDEDQDQAMARHILHVHQHCEAPALQFQPIEPNILRAYLAEARRFNPYIPRELTEYIASAYATLRQEEAQSEVPHSYTTARTLLSIMRLSEALARLRFSTTVDQADVDEALRLMHMSKFSLYADERKRSGLDAISDIYATIRDEAARRDTLDVTYADALNWIARKGLKEAQLKECLEEYASLNVWQINPTTLDIHFIDN